MSCVTKTKRRRQCNKDQLEMSEWQHKPSVLQKQTNKVGVCLLFSPHWNIFAVTCAHMHQWNWSVLFLIPQLYQHTGEKEAYDNKFDKSGTSCLPVTFLSAKNVGQVRDLAALSACNLFWIATSWNQLSRKVKAVINQWSILWECSLPTALVREITFHHIALSKRWIITLNHTLR